MVAQVGPLWTVAEYLLPERYSTIKHEYHGGYVYALAGGSQAHSQIAGKMLPTTADQGETSGDLGTAVGLYARTHGGHYYAAETGFNLTLPGEAEETVLGPDAAYIGDEIVPRDPHGFVARAPDLAVEVASPTQFRSEMEGKVHVWLARGCRLVWLVWPRYKTIEVWRPGDTVPRQTLHPGDDLDGADVLPGFRYPVARAFN